LDETILQRGLEAAAEYGSAIAGVPVKDTIKIVSPRQIVDKTLDRSLLWAAQTPQVFRFQTLLDAHHDLDKDVTDDATMIEGLGHQVKMFLGAYENIKVTTAEDLVIAEAFLKAAVGT
tara:strand:- start:608 stop:961 length:354 start_codon:yes stop_codon:yes gene_type:complete